MTMLPFRAAAAQFRASDAAEALGFVPRPRGARVALLLALLLTGCDPVSSTVTPAQPPRKEADIVRVAADQMHQLSIIKVETYNFRIEKPAIGQIAFNEDASTFILAPFSGRVTRVLAKIGDELKRGDPLFEIDSPEVGQAHTDLIAAVQGLEKAKSQVALAKRQFDRYSRLITNNAISHRDLDQAQNDHAAAESDLKTAQGTLNSARNRLRIIIGRDQAEVDLVERERVVNPLITINAPINGTIISRKVGPGQYVRSDSTDVLYAMADLSTMWLKANVPEIDIPLVQVGQEIEVRITALPGRVFKARITAIGASSDA
jgi:membrane fusion protein, heavy metal efflux system